MRIAIAGSSGVIGTALSESLSTNGHQVVRLVRREVDGPDQIEWDPQGGTVGPGLNEVDAVINLAGAGVGDRRWTKAYKKEIRDSRVLGTITLARAMARAENPPSVLINGSAIGYYGNSGPDPVTENAPAGEGFLADVVVDWEKATSPASDAGIRVAMIRTGLVVSAEGGAFGRLLPLFKYGLGGRVGSGNQFWSFISLRDEVRAIEFILNSELSGPVNLVAPHAITNRDVTRALAKSVHRPAFLPVPALALKAVLGEFADDILASQNVVPQVLSDAGFAWQDPTIDEALTSAREAIAS